jgi:hypothetical protein
MEQMRSPMNPADLAAMKQSGKISRNLSIREYFANLGVDVDGPATQLVEMAKRQMQNADPRNKMKALANSNPPADPVRQQMAGRGAPPPGKGAPRPPRQPQPQGGGAPPQGGGLRELLGG